MTAPALVASWYGGELCRPCRSPPDSVCPLSTIFAPQFVQVDTSAAGRAALGTARGEANFALNALMEIPEQCAILPARTQSVAACAGLHCLVSCSPATEGCSSRPGETRRATLLFHARRRAEFCVVAKEMRSSTL